MIQIAESTHQELVTMYNEVPKEELIEMLIQSNKVIKLLSKPRLELSLKNQGIQKGHEFHAIIGKP